MNETATLTRNARLAELAALAHEFLTSYAGLPAACNIRLDDNPGDTSGEIDLQLSVRSGGLYAVAEWAVELGTTVRVRDCDTAIEVSVWTTTHGHSVSIWDRLRPRIVDQVLNAIGVVLHDRGSVEIDPARLLDRQSSGDGGS